MQHIAIAFSNQVCSVYGRGNAYQQYRIYNMMATMEKLGSTRKLWLGFTNMYQQKGSLLYSFSENKQNKNWNQAEYYVCN